MVACDSMKIQCTRVAVPPSSMRSKSCKRRGSTPMRLLFTNVPFRLPRSAIQKPLGVAADARMLARDAGLLQHDIVKGGATYHRHAG